MAVVGAMWVAYRFMTDRSGLDLERLEAAARAAMHSAAFDYYAGGADDEHTVADNVAAWSRIRLRPRVLRDVSHVSTGAEVLGAELSMPVAVAPTAYQRLAHPDGEIATARAAAGAGTLMVVSTMATTMLEDVASAAPAGTRWFQLYVHRDRELTADLIRRAEAAGYGAVVFTVDAPVLGRRPRDEHNDFDLPAGLTMANLGAGTPHVSGSSLAAYAGHEFDPSISFGDIEWIRSITTLPVVVKGVLRGDDAVAAIESGAAGVVVSNHGGRQLDSALATADALSDVVAAVSDRGVVAVDGGIRRGTDVVKALALGADLVLLGRPVLWGLAANGEDGVLGVLSGFQAELARAMALCGARDIDEIEFDLLA